MPQVTGWVKTSITSNNFTAFQFWGSPLNKHGSFFLPTEFGILYNHPKAVLWVPIWEAAQKDGNFLKSPGCLAHTEEQPFSVLWHWMIFQAQDYDSQHFPQFNVYHPVHPTPFPLFLLSLLLVLVFLWSCFSCRQLFTLVLLFSLQPSSDVTIFSLVLNFYFDFAEQVEPHKSA